MSETLYNVRHADGSVYGPATLGVLRQWVREGRIVAETTVAQDGSAHWRPARLVPGLGDLFPSTHTPDPAAAGHPGDATPAVTTVQVRRIEGGPEPAAANDPVPTRLHPLAVLALMFSMAGALAGAGSCCCCLAWPAAASGLLGALLGAVALVQCRRSPQRYRGKGMSQAALILGLAVAVLVLIGKTFWPFT